MRSFILLICLLLTTTIFAQKREYPITTILKGDSVVILTIKQSEKINELIDSLTLENIKIKSKLLVEQDNVSSLKTQLEKSNIKHKKELDSVKTSVDSFMTRFNQLDSFKNDILELAWLGSIIYQRDNGKFYYINLASYRWTIWGNDKMVFRPIKDETKWRSMRIDGYPQPDNLSLHLWPHKYDGDKLRIQKK